MAVPNREVNQSSLGQVGKALVRFASPILKSEPVVIGDPSAGPKSTLHTWSIKLTLCSTRTHSAIAPESSTSSDTAIKKSESNDATTSQGTLPHGSSEPSEGRVVESNQRVGEEPTEAMITVHSDPRVSWVQLSAKLRRTCKESAENSLSKMSAKKYGACSACAGSNSGKNVGRIIDLVAESMEEDDSQEDLKTQPSAGSTESSTKPKLHPSGSEKATQQTNSILVKKAA